MKSILLSIKPKYVELIARGEKTIEVRKTAPKEVPFKAYIYCTKEKKQDDIIWAGIFGDRGKWNGRVIGEFICDNVERFEEHIEKGGLYYILSDTFNEQAQLDNWELHDYGKGKTIYGWHISDLKIYDKPKELGDFKKHCHYKDRNSYCLANECEYYSDWTGICCNWVERPPQSWCYVKDLGEEE